jgi:hypothetical protein
MKKALFFAGLFSLIPIISFSQEIAGPINKNGVPVLPAAGDIAFGISANPFLNFAGNLFNNSGTNSLSLALPDNALYGKYFLNSTNVIRVKLGISRTATSRESIVPDDTNNDLTVTDRLDYINSSLTFSAGYEKRKGSKRLQLFYGAELSTGFSKSSYEYSYGNPFSEAYPFPTSTYDFYNGGYNQVNSRNTENIESSGFGVGLRAFTGLEYFILPKISVGGEFGLGYSRYFGGKNTINSERWDYANGRLETTTNQVSINYAQTASDISDGSIFLLFHF